ncbi:hypothetical protein D9757_009721 [Collybiopsis confluens]|uniref:Glucose-methanol-choline oxidoreductase N-terminal domain-containing protein n=1 Tax=Collybiopsis confluens TaxID=2823264 RepID=A0A8H5H6Q6_9AGAR|nr:hypothetical protein D9757_009721 [Collybiopsis confluens]
MLKSIVQTVFIILPSLSLSFAALYENDGELDPAARYDYVIIGGGTAGSVLANRLTEDTLISVLVLEAGGSNIGAVPTEIPFFCTLPHPQYDWNYTTTAQVGLNDRKIGFARGFILGGSSSISRYRRAYRSSESYQLTTPIDGLFYTRGSEDDFNRLANVTGDSGWTWENLQPFFRRNERWTPPADNHNTTGQYDPSIHSLNGINAVSLAGFPQSINGKIIQASSELGGIFEYNLDMNSGNPLGLGKSLFYCDYGQDAYRVYEGWLQTTIDGGNRSSAATSYLGPRFINRPNLHVLTNTRVTAILQKNNASSNDMSAMLTTVEFASTPTGPRHRVTASKEVLLSAGAIGTPQILMNSGIGNSTSLASLGIKPLIDLPSVGQNFSDHPRLVNSWAVSGNQTFDEIYRNSTLSEALQNLWNTKGKGPLVDTFVSHLLFARLNHSALDGFGEDPAAGEHTAHYELGFSNGDISVATTGHYIGITTRVVTPVSRGSISLNTTDPFSPPIINPALLSTDFDIFAMRQAVRTGIQFLRAPVWSGYILGDPNTLMVPGANTSFQATNDEQLDEYIRMGTGTSAHAVGTAAMTRLDAGYGVVDPDFRVKGVKGLRVVDASIFPFVPSAHTQAPVYVIAERAAAMIKNELG